MWGKFHPVFLYRIGQRFTPTYVGKMSSKRVLVRRIFGSPPRAWGESRAAAAPARQSAVHPHVRGENVFQPFLQQFPGRFTPTCVGRMTVGERHFSRRVGSPPRAWGEYFPQILERHQIRFTPTCVGRIPAQYRPANWRGGSPPRAWGEFRPIHSNALQYTVHPHVRGENGTHSRKWRCRSPVHPHVRGENGFSYSGPFMPCGSPPRAWGECLPGVHLGKLHRFTPTCVGRIFTNKCYHDLRSVHPHVRGENAAIAWEPTAETGSPPRAWGEFHPKRAARLHNRFTPTCVGRMEDDEAAARMEAGSPPRAWGECS